MRGDRMDLIGPVICRHCGYFLDYAIPKAPGKEGWQHSQYRPDAPPPGHAGPCQDPEPRP